MSSYAPQWLASESYMPLWTPRGCIAKSLLVSTIIAETRDSAHVTSGQPGVTDSEDSGGSFRQHHLDHLHILGDPQALAQSFAIILYHRLVDTRYLI